MADRTGITDVRQLAGHEQEVLQQVADDLAADVAIAQSINSALDSVRALVRAADARGATVATVLARREAASARSFLDSAITRVDAKSLSTARDRLAAGLPGPRALLDFAPAPTNLAGLRAGLTRVSTMLHTLHPSAANAAMFLARTRDILGSSLAGPAASPAERSDTGDHAGPDAGDRAQTSADDTVSP